MKHTRPLIMLTLLAACSPASDEAELALDNAPDPQAHAVVTETALASMGMAEARETDRPVVHVWKSPTCGCCEGWVKHLEAAGFPVEVENVQDVNAIKRARGIPGGVWSCHTAEVDGYLIEGHVPAATIDRVLAERPQVVGVAVPGMPMGSPGMEMPGMAPDPYQVVSFTAQGRLDLYEQH
jgi:hypothetical protein